MEIGINDGDEVIEVRENGDYTIKMYQKEDCKFYCVVVYETDEDSVVVARTKNQSTKGKAMADAESALNRHKSKR